MKSSEHRYTKAHSYIHKRSLNELYAAFKIVSVILFFLFSTSAFIVQKDFLDYSRFDPGKAQSNNIEKLNDVITLGEEFLPSNEGEVNYEGAEILSEDSWGYSLDHKTEVVKAFETTERKPAISAKIAKLIQVTSSESIDIEASYTIVG